MDINKINDKIAISITKLVSTMWCVYLFAGMVMIPLFAPSTTTVIQFISSAFLQLVFLPLILVGQDLLGQKSEARAQQDHDTIMAEMAEIRAIHQDLHSVLTVNGIVCIHCSNAIVENSKLDTNS